MQGFKQQQSNSRHFEAKRSSMLRTGFVLAAFLVGAQLSGCSLLRSVGLLPSEEKAKVKAAEVPLSEQPYEFTLVVMASNDVNPDPQSRPSPIRTRIFLNENATDISDRPFEQIFQFDGNDLDPAPVATIMLQPGETKKIKLTGVKTQNRLTIAAAYRDPYNTTWIISKTIEPDTTVRLTTEINAATIAFTSP